MNELTTGILADDILIDAEFETLCPPLSPDEYATLEASILSEGCRDALVLWQGHNILLDGHNRKRICDEYGLDFDVIWMELEDRDAARKWILLNQLGRRNVSPMAAALMRGMLYNAEKRDRTDNLIQNSPKYQSDTSGDTASRLASELGVSAPTIKRDGRLADAVETLTPYMPDLPQMVMSGDAPSRKDVIEAAELAKTEPTKAAHQLISQSKSNEWYTPPKYVEAARTVMGGLDVDPASNDIAQEWIEATEYHTIEDDGLLYDWRGRVWLNPPWGNSGSRFVARLIEQLAIGNTTEAVLLVNAHATDTKWFAPLWDGLLCFTDHRINYYPGAPDPGSADDDTAKGGSTHGSVFVYFGPNRGAFVREFSQWGAIVERVAVEH